MPSFGTGMLVPVGGCAGAQGGMLHHTRENVSTHASLPCKGAALKSARGPRNAQSLWPRPAGGDIDGPGNGYSRIAAPNFPPF
eukprot:3194154-Amphidinium_carterae.1